MIVKKQVLLFGIILTVLLDSVKSDLTTSTNELEITVNDCVEFDVILTESINRSLAVKLDTNNGDIIEFKNNLIYFNASDSTQSQTVTICGRSIGHAEITAEPTKNIIRKNTAFVDVSVHRYESLNIVSLICGWIYFAVWSISFYPQLYTNYKRKSVVGLNFDFLSLNVVGFFLYALFNVGLYFLPVVKEQYSDRHPRGLNPIQLNDIFFSVHAFIISSITVMQCFIYEKADQCVSLVARIIIVIYFGILVVSGVLVFVHYIELLDHLYVCSYIKLSITMIKYIPQALMNYRRKSTVGWSIGNIFCDFTGGSFSIIQMIVISYNYDDWISIFGDFTKFGLGLISVLFDVLFFFQHYVLYRNSAVDCDPMKTTTNT